MRTSCNKYNMVDKRSTYKIDQRIGENTIFDGGEIDRRVRVIMRKIGEKPVFSIWET